MPQKRVFVSGSKVPVIHVAPPPPYCARAVPPSGRAALAPDTSRRSKFVGVAVFESALQAAGSGRTRLWRGWLFGLGWLAPGMVWMWFLTAPGYMVATLMFALLHGVAAWAAPRGALKQA